MYFRTVARLIPNSRAIPRMDMPLRFAFCMAFQRAFWRNVAFRGGMAATLPAAVSRLSNRVRRGFFGTIGVELERGSSPKTWRDGQDRNGGWQSVGMIRCRFA